MELIRGLKESDFFFFPCMNGLGITFIRQGKIIARVIWEHDKEGLKYRIDTKVSIPNVTPYFIKSHTDRAYRFMVEFNELTHRFDLKFEQKMQLKNLLAGLLLEMICAPGCAKEKMKSIS